MINRYLLLPFFVSILSISFSAHSQVTKEQLNKVFTIFEEIYTPKLAEGEIILFNNIAYEGQPDWLDYDIFRAAYHYGADIEGNDVHFIWIFGGVINANFMTVDGLALLMCHELGHGFGGAPFKKGGSTTEGQSDYYSTGSCLDQFMDAWPIEHTIESDYSDFEVPVLELCDYNLRCLRKMRAIETRVADFSQNEQTQTSLLDRDETIVDRVEIDDWFYPSQQCRIDTYVAGALGLPRPSCWYAPGTY